MTRIHLDFETRSEVDIKKSGAWVYSRHHSTSIICAAYAIDNEPVVLLREHEINQLTELVNDYPDAIFVAHNAFFEQCIWHNTIKGLPTLPPERWVCTAAKAANMSLPRDLERAGEALGLDTKKDKDGYKVMMRLCRPRRKRGDDKYTFITEADEPDEYEKIYKYNIIDVEVERLIDEKLPELSPSERKLWILDQKINMKGIYLDSKAVHQTLKFIDITTQDLLSQFKDVVNQELSSPNQRDRFREWLSNNGVDLPDLQKATVDKALATLDPIKFKVELEALSIRAKLSKISTAKYSTMLQRVDMFDSRIRDVILFYAAHTGRWSSRGVQFQNMARGTENSDTAIDCIMLDDYEWFSDCYPDPMAVYSSCVRGMITASPGNELYVADFSAIEAMVLPWLAGQEHTLDIFRRGEDIYCHSAASIYGYDVTPKHKPERMVGKVGTLSLGYNGGIGAYGAMALAYGISLLPAYESIWPGATEDEKDSATKAYKTYLARAIKKDPDKEPLDEKSGLAADTIKQRWRIANHKIVNFWHELEKAAIAAVRTGAKTYVGGGGIPLITFGMVRDTLICKLPSSNFISYPSAKITEHETPWGQKKPTLTYKTVDSSTNTWLRTHSYGGKLAENITQAVARDILAAAMLRLDDANFNIILTVHDEVISDEPLERKELNKFSHIMAQVPVWAEGIPIKVEAWSGKRYKK